MAKQLEAPDAAEATEDEAATSSSGREARSVDDAERVLEDQAEVRHLLDETRRSLTARKSGDPEEDEKLDERIDRLEKIYEQFERATNHFALLLRATADDMTVVNLVARRTGYVPSMQDLLMVLYAVERVRFPKWVDDRAAKAALIYLLERDPQSLNAVKNLISKAGTEDLGKLMRYVRGQRGK